MLCKSFIHQRIKIIAVPPVVGEYREEIFMNESRLFIKEFAVGNLRMSGKRNSPFPRVGLNITAPPRGNKRAFFHGKARNSAREKRKKAYYPQKHK